MGIVDGMSAKGTNTTREFPAVIAVWINWQLVRDRPEELAVSLKPGNSGGGKGS
jgi:hypothetical protein